MVNKKQIDTQNHLVLKSVLIFVLSLAIVILAYQFRSQLEQFRSLGLFGILLINFIGNVTLFLPAPAIASVVAGGSIYPPIAVALSAAFGASLGDMVGFLFGLSGKKLTAKKQGRLYERVTSLFKKYGTVLIFLFAFIPNPFFDGIGIIAGALSYPPKQFFVIMLLARFTRNLLLAYAGAKYL